MKILLSYSRGIFDPDKAPSEHHLWDSSANILARSLYGMLSAHGSVTYIDPAEHESLRGQHFDLFVGVFPHFADTLASCSIDRSVFLAVNMHPHVRNEILLDFIAQEGLPLRALSGRDIVDPTPVLASLSGADLVLSNGNLTTWRSYVHQGLPRHKVRLFNYGTAEPVTPGSSKDGARTRRFVYCASEIGLRKGFDLVLDMFERLAATRNDFHLDIVGEPSTPYYERKLRAAANLMGDHLTAHGWLSSSAPAYDAVLRQSEFIVFPSLEEGSPGTVLDALGRGVVPLVSRHAGLDFAPLGFLELATGPDNLRLLEHVCELSGAEVDRYRAATLDYYEEFHLPRAMRLEAALEDFLSGAAYPPLSLLALGEAEQTSERVTAMRDLATAYGPVTVETVTEGAALGQALLGSQGRYVVVVDSASEWAQSADLLFEGVTFLESNPQADVLLLEALFVRRDALDEPRDGGLHAMSMASLAARLATEAAQRGRGAFQAIDARIVPFGDADPAVWLHRVPELPRPPRGLRRRYVDARRRWLHAGWLTHRLGRLAAPNP